MTIYELQGQRPRIHPSAFIHPDAVLIGSVTLNRAIVRRGSIVGAQALVPEGFVIPAGSKALGVPVRVSGHIDNSSWIDYGVGEYLLARRRYRAELSAVPLEQCLTENNSARSPK